MPLSLPRLWRGVFIFFIVYSMNKKILLADDESINRLFVKTILASQGWEVWEATNGKEALDLYTSGDFDLVILDIKMPVMGGVEACRKIRELEAAGDKSLRIPILGFTAYGGSAINEELSASGMNDLIRKPVTRESLLKTISSFLS